MKPVVSKEEFLAASRRASHNGPAPPMNTSAQIYLECSSLQPFDGPDADLVAGDLPLLLSGKSSWKDWEINIVDLLREFYGNRRISGFRTLYGSVVQTPRRLHARYAKLVDEILSTWTLSQYLDTAQEKELPVYLANLALRDLPEVYKYYEQCTKLGGNLLRRIERASAPELFIGANNTQYGGLHVDAGGGSVWCVCLTGAKEWVVFPPSDSEELKPHRSGDSQLRHSFLNPWNEATCSQYSTERLHPYRVFLRAGEALYLPPNWWHITRNHALTITINERMWQWKTVALLVRWFWYVAWGKVLPGTRQPFVLY
jgi:hypothetical protein